MWSRKTSTGNHYWVVQQLSDCNESPEGLLHYDAAEQWPEIFLFYHKADLLTDGSGLHGLISAVNTVDK